MLSGAATLLATPSGAPEEERESEEEEGQGAAASGGGGGAASGALAFAAAEVAGHHASGGDVNVDALLAEVDDTGFDFGGVDVLTVAEEGAIGLGALNFAATFELGKAVQIAVEVDLSRAGTGAAASAVLLAVARRYFAALVAVDVAFGDGHIFAIVTSAIGLAQLARGPVALAVTAGEAVEERGIAGGDALRAAAVDTLGFRIDGTAAGAGGLELERGTLGFAAAFDLYLAGDAVGEIEIAAGLGGLSVGSTRAEYEHGSDEKCAR